MTTRTGHLSTTRVSGWLNELALAVPYLGLHLSDPFAAGDPLTTEVSGGSYSRSTVNWVISGRLLYNNVMLDWPSVPAGTTVNYIGGWTAATNGTLEFASLIPGGLYVGVQQAVVLNNQQFYVGFDTA